MPHQPSAASGKTTLHGEVALQQPRDESCSTVTTHMPTHMLQHLVSAHHCHELLKVNHSVSVRINILIMGHAFEMAARWSCKRITTDSCKSVAIMLWPNCSST
eukprot:855413-Amphidinium_carterae.1